MSKLKTKKVVSKRFKISKKGVILRGRQMGRHLRFNKSKSKIRQFKEPARVEGKMAKAVRRLMPYA